MIKFVQFVREIVPDRALCESIVAGYHACLEADEAEDRYRLSDWRADAKAASDVKIAKANAEKTAKGNAEANGRDVSKRGSREPSRVATSGGATTSHDPACGNDGGAVTPVAANMDAEKVGGSKKQWRRQSTKAGGSRKSAPAVGSQKSAAASTDFPHKRNVASVSGADSANEHYTTKNPKVAAKAREFYDNANNLWREKYNEDPPEEQRIRNYQNALKMAGQWHRHFMAEDHDDTALISVSGPATKAPPLNGAMAKHRALMHQADKAMDNMHKVYSGGQAPRGNEQQAATRRVPNPNRRSESREKYRDLLSKGDEALKNINSQMSSFRKNS